LNPRAFAWASIQSATSSALKNGVPVGRSWVVAPAQLPAVSGSVRAAARHSARTRHRA
jgi:hypothetical protein